MNDQEKKANLRRMGFPKDSKKYKSIMKPFLKDKWYPVFRWLFLILMVYPVLYGIEYLAYLGSDIPWMAAPVFSFYTYFLIEVNLIVIIYIPFMLLPNVFLWMKDNHKTYNTPLYDQWPTRAMESALRKYSLMEDEEKKNPKITWSTLHESLDSEQARLQLLDFMPCIWIKGIDQQIERFLTGRFAVWGGVYARVLENIHNIRERCLQYIFVYTRQSSSVSLIWWVVFPPVFTVFYTWGVIWGSSNFWDIIVVSIALPITSLVCHMTDPTNKARFHPATPLAFYWLILFTGFFHTIWPTILLLLWSIFFLGVWILDVFEAKLGRLRKFRFGHPMDYIPIFVYLEQDANDKWILGKICWDEWHYKARMKKARDIPPAYKDNNQRVSFLLDNPWHSLRLGTIFWPRYLLIMIAVCGWMVPLTISSIIPGLESISEWLIFSGFFAISILWGVYSGIYLWINEEIDLFPEYDDKLSSIHNGTQEIEALETYANLKHLTGPDDRVKGISRGDWKDDLWSDLEILWNLKRIGAEWEEEGPKLVVVSKLQEPFDLKPPKFTFRDESEDLYSRISKLEHDITKLM